MMQFYVIKRNCTNFQNSKIVKKTSLLLIGNFSTIIIHAYEQNIYLCPFVKRGCMKFEVKNVS